MFMVYIYFSRGYRLFLVLEDYELMRNYFVFSGTPVYPRNCLLANTAGRSPLLLKNHSV